MSLLPTSKSDPGPRVYQAPNGIDPFEAAAMWLVEGGLDVIVVGAEGRRQSSVHARALIEGVPEMGAALHGPYLEQPGLRVVLAMPDPAQLESLEAVGLHWSTKWFLIPSVEDPDARCYQDAWAWACERPSAGRRPAKRGGAHAVADPFGLFSTQELWALVLRAGVPGEWAEALRAESLGGVEPLAEVVWPGEVVSLANARSLRAKSAGRGERS